MLEVTARKQVLLEAEPGQSVYVGLSYAFPSGREMIGTVSRSRRGPVKGESNSKEYYYTEHSCLVRSPDNGATLLPEETLVDERDGFTGTQVTFGPMRYLDPDTGRLLRIHATAKLDCAGGKDAFYGATNIRQRTFRMFYSISADGGRTWMPDRQIIHRGDGFDETHWLPGVEYGRNSACFGMRRFAKTADGAIVLPIVKFVTYDNTRNIKYCDHENSKVVGFLLGRWTENLDGIEWEASEYLDCPIEERPSGIAEPDIVSLGGRRLFSTMRAMGTKELNIPSLRMCSLSEDGGRTWTQPKPLTYDDGSTVWVPACPSEFLTAPGENKICWVANILEEPTYGRYPRTPLAIALFDPDRLCIIRDSVRIFWKKPDDMKPADRRYTNWSSYRDRETGEFVLTMAEEWKYSKKDYTADAIAIRLALQPTA